MKKLRNKKGFTLIELLVVIAIISILASILFVAIDPKGQTDKAKATKIAQDFRNIEQAFQLTALDKNRETYPRETEFTSNRIINIINNGELNHLSNNIKPGIGANYYFYDNDKDVYPYINNCPGSSNSSGANIFISDVVAGTQDNLANELDQIIDNGDGLLCGRFRTYNSTYFGYVLDSNE